VFTVAIDTSPHRRLAMSYPYIAIAAAWLLAAAGIVVAAERALGHGDASPSPAPVGDTRMRRALARLRRVRRRS
jgi:hypothetical protein